MTQGVIWCSVTWEKKNVQDDSEHLNGDLQGKKGMEHLEFSSCPRHLVQLFLTIYRSQAEPSIHFTDCTRVVPSLNQVWIRGKWGPLLHWHNAVTESTEPISFNHYFNDSGTLLARSANEWLLPSSLSLQIVSHPYQLWQLKIEMSQNHRIIVGKDL